MDKIVLEKLLKKPEAKRLLQMILASKDDAYIAFSVLFGLKPHIFKKENDEND